MAEIEKKTSYPFILVGGMFTFGEEELLSKKYPYFGWWKADVREVIRAEGLDCYTPSTGPVSSAWDKACELYASLVGGQVDYGKAHSQKHGHERYGRTYQKALVPNWGQKDEKGNTLKVNLVGHSFGAPTSRTLIELLVHGSEEERQATPDNELSDLFRGGHENWVHSLTSLSGILEGTTLAHFLEDFHMHKGLLYLVWGMGSLLSRSKFSQVFDARADHFGITVPPGTELGLKLKWSEMKAAAAGTDHMLNDAYPDVVRKNNQTFTSQAFDNIYYFSHMASTIREKPFMGRDVPDLKALKSCPPLVLTAWLMDIHKNKVKTHVPPTDEGWGPNDGACNVKGSRAPFDEPQVDFTPDMEIHPGIWHKMPIDYGATHQTYAGWGPRKEEYISFFEELVKRICALDPTE